MLARCSGSAGGAFVTATCLRFAGFSLALSRQSTNLIPESFAAENQARAKVPPWRRDELPENRGHLSSVFGLRNTPRATKVAQL